MAAQVGYQLRRVLADQARQERDDRALARLAPRERELVQLRSDIRHHSTVMDGYAETDAATGETPSRGALLVRSLVSVKLDAMLDREATLLNA